MKKIITVLMLCTMLFCFGCEINNSSKNHKSVHQQIAQRVVDYGNNVYYFPENGENFGNALSDFIKSRPDLELVSMAGDGTGMYGRDDGYFVIFRVKK